MADVARAATYGLVETVLVDIDESMPGSIEEDGAVTFDAVEDAVNYGILDEIARRVWLTGGRVLAVRQPDIPGAGAGAALLRYVPCRSAWLSARADGRHGSRRGQRAGYEIDRAERSRCPAMKSRYQW